MSSFALQMKKFENLTEKKAEAIFKKVCFELSSDIIATTPVDSGRAKGNWQPDINSVASGIIEVEDIQGSATVTKVGTSTNNLKLGQYFTLTNNLPYILRLEYGYSRKSPNGMVDINVMRFNNIVQSTAKATK
jgi:hypothetical protein